jgi:hypothetical protein
MLSFKRYCIGSLESVRWKQKLNKAKRADQDQ